MHSIVEKYVISGASTWKIQVTREHFWKTLCKTSKDSFGASCTMQKYHKRQILEAATLEPWLIDQQDVFCISLSQSVRVEAQEFE